MAQKSWMKFYSCLWNMMMIWGLISLFLLLLGDLLKSRNIKIICNSTGFLRFCLISTISGNFKPSFVPISAIESQKVELSYQRIPLQLFLFWSLKSLWLIRGAFLKNWQLRWPPRRNIASEYPCATAILVATSSGSLPVRLVGKKTIFWWCY